MNGLKKLNDLLFPGAKTYERVRARRWRWASSTLSP